MVKINDSFSETILQVELRHSSSNVASIIESNPPEKRIATGAQSPILALCMRKLCHSVFSEMRKFTRKKITANEFLFNFAWPSH